MKKPIIINFFGAPGSGKSTCAAKIFSLLKKTGFNVEYVTEFTKDLWNYYGIVPPYNQAFVFGNQLHRINECIKVYDIIITDSPLLLSIIYNEEPYLNDNFISVVMDSFNYFNNLNYLCRRKFRYNQLGRYQNEQQSSILEDKIIKLLEQYNIYYEEIDYLNCNNIINTVKSF